MVKRALSFLSLFLSLGTLVCCALPALFVILGLGATFVSLLAAFPQLIWFSEHKAVVFGAAGVLLVVTASIRRRSERQPCPTATELAAQCRSVKGTGAVVFYLSVACYLVSGFFAFIAPLLF